MFGITGKQVFIIALIVHLIVSITLCVLSWMSWSDESGVGSEAEARKTKCFWNAMAWTASLAVIALFMCFVFATKLLA
jgi:hypothetical protein